jgi:GT2 family glycosyltransferase
MSPEAAPQVAIVLLNWNGWKNTVECLESVFRLNYPAFRVIVCDNASTDGSLDRIRDWADGKILAPCPSAELARLVVLPLPKPVRYVIVQASGDSAAVSSAVQLELIPTGGNLGFAGGNNVGIRYALSRPDCQYLWLLNNDTVVEPDALSALIRTVQADPEIGLCGSILRDYSRPASVLTLGGRRYGRWSGRTWPILPGSPTGQDGIPVFLDYVEGASLLVTREFLETVGLMAEDYFLYFEEMDWVMRARARFRLGFSPQSIVYHKEGESIGSHKNRNLRSAMTDYYQARNRLIFTRRYLPWLLPSIFASITGTAVHRLLTGRWQNAGAVVKGALSVMNKR